MSVRLFIQQNNCWSTISRDRSTGDPQILRFTINHYCRGSRWWSLLLVSSDAITMMPTPQSPPSPSSNPPAPNPHPIVLQAAYPYFTQKQIIALSTRLRTPLLSENKEIQIRLQACYWIEEVGNYLQWYPSFLRLLCIDVVAVLCAQSERR